MRLASNVTERRASLAPLLMVGLILCGSPGLAASSSRRARSSAAPSTGRDTQARGPGKPLLWPLQVPGNVLASFGEYRYDHLHAGIDISTAGVTGYKVLAADAGEVFRLKVEWRGYGRAIYLRHSSGRVTVYGHLERYEDAVLHLERLVARRPTEAKTRYPGDIHLDSPVRVRRGQVIGFSGESGVGLPHLHFEVRDRQDAPIDPFEAGLPRRGDRRPPVLETLIVTSGSPATWIDGDAREKTYPLRGNGENRLTIDGAVRVNGPFLAAIAAYDPAGETGRAGLHAIEASIDGGLRYHLAFRSFRFDQYPESGLIYDHRYSRLGPPAFAYRLFPLPGNELASGPEGAGAAPGGYPGAFDLDPGSHLLDITAEDSAGNRARARVCILVDHPPTPGEVDWDPTMGGGALRLGVPPSEPSPIPPGSMPEPGCPTSPQRVEAEYWDTTVEGFRAMTCDAGARTCSPPPGAAPAGTRAARVRQWRNGVIGPWRLVTAPRSQSSGTSDVAPLVSAWPASLDIRASMRGPIAAPLAVAAGSPTSILEPLVYGSDLTWVAGLAYPRASGSAPFFIVSPGAASALASLALDVRWVEPGHPLEYQGPGFALTLPASARFFAGPVALRTERVAGTDRLPSMAEAIDLLPEGEALNERGILSFEINPEAVPPQSLGIYRWDARHETWSYEGGDTEAGGTRMTLRFRRYGRFALLQDASPPEILELHPSAGSRGVPRRPGIWARVTEEGKGLDFDGVRFEIDGRLLESEFDPDRGLSRVLEPPSLAPGLHHLRVVATDLAGNVSQPVEGQFEVR